MKVSYENNVNIYEFKWEYDIKELEKLIKDYLLINGFRKIGKKSEHNYKSVVGELVSYHRYFKYKIDGNKLFIYVSMKSMFNKIELKNTNNKDNIYVKDYLQSLVELFDEIDILNGDKRKRELKEKELLENKYDLDSEYAPTKDDKKREAILKIIFEVESCTGILLAFFIFFLSIVNEKYDSIFFISVFLINIDGLFKKKYIRSIIALILLFVSFIIFCINFFNGF